MFAVADEEALYLLEFVERRKGLQRQIERLCKKLQATIILGDTPLLQQVRAQLKDYFAGKSLNFSVSLNLTGSPFQQSVWHELCKIPPGETRSYLQVAQALNEPGAFRAVANANRVNQIAIIIPCHRVINANGDLGGYSGGISCKQWLLAHEENFCQKNQ